MAACWMLTPDDDRTDGRLIKYLNEPAKWRPFDPPLFDHLRELVLDQNLRDIRGAETPAILPSCRFGPGILPDDAGGRAKYFEAFMELAEGCDLVFFDPDNGIEVRSKPYGRKDSSKHVYWQELVNAFRAGPSVLIYQHFPRVKREPFIQELAKELALKTSAQEVFSFRTPRVLFLLAPPEHHRKLLEGHSEKVEEVWGSQMRLTRHLSRCPSPSPQ